MVLEGYLDRGSNSNVYGWAWDTDNPNATITVDIVISGRIFQNVSANKFRKDLRRQERETACMHLCLKFLKIF